MPEPGTFFFGLFLGLAGCSHTPGRTPGKDVAPAQWQSAPAPTAAVPQRWLETFDDPRLTALVSQALTGNFNLRVIHARIAAAREQAAIEGAGRWPQVDFSPAHRRADPGANRDAPHNFRAYEALFNVAWEIDLWGRIAASRDALRLDADAAAADYHGARLALAALTAQTYFELVEARLQMEVARQSVEDRRNIAGLIRGRFMRGLTHGLDLSLVLTDVANAEAQLAQAENSMAQLERLLETLLGRYPAGEVATADRLPDLSESIPADLPSTLLARRPDIAASLNRLKAMDKRVESAEKEWLPRITLTSGGGIASTDLSQFADPRALAWNVGMGLLQPVFTAGRIESTIRLNEANARAAYNNYRETLLTAFREVEQALAAEQWLRTEEQALRRAVAQTQASQLMAIDSYRKGMIEILTLLDSYRSVLNAQSDHLRVKRQLINNRIGLYLALGGAD